MVNDRLDKQDAEQRLRQFSTLASVLGPNWFTQEYSKPIEQWSLITGWVSRIHDKIFGDQFEKWLKDLDMALKFLESRLSIAAWQKLECKVRAHSDRAGFKGTLSEIAMCRFLAEKQFPLDLEIRLNSQSSKDVDVRVTMPDSVILHIEVQWLSPSESSERGAAIASTYGEGYPPDYDEEKLRVKYKVHDKTSKFTVEDITLVALDCTSSPELGGDHGYSVIEEALHEACTGRSWQGVPTGFGNSAVDTAIRKYVDGVIWFELTPGNDLLPHKRGMYINSESPHRGKIEGSTFAQAWRDRK
jgi:hypothetical protein